MFNDLRQNDTELPDFHVDVIGIQNGMARISIGPKEPASLNHGVMVEPSLRNESVTYYSPWDDFYWRTEPGPTLNSIPVKDIPRYNPGTPTENTYVWPNSKLRAGGEFEIPMNTDIYFWVKIPGSFMKDEQANVRGSAIGDPYLGNFDFKNQNRNMRIEFGSTVPTDTAPSKNPISNLWTYFFHLPIFKIAVAATGVNLQMYDIGECVFISETTEIQANLLNFSKISSYFD